LAVDVSEEKTNTEENREIFLDDFKSGEWYGLK